MTMWEFRRVPQMCSLCLCPTDGTGDHEWCRDRARAVEATQHVAAVCKEAGLGVMLAVFEVVDDREDVSVEALMSLTAEDVTRMYETLIAPAIDRVEDELLDV